MDLEAVGERVTGREKRKDGFELEQAKQPTRRESLPKEWRKDAREGKVELTSSVDLTHEARPSQQLQLQGYFSRLRTKHSAASGRL